MTSFAIVGCGALGGLYGGYLHDASNEVHFLLHSDYTHVKDNGFRIDSIWGDLHLRDIPIYHNSENMPQVDVVCVCWKSTQNHLIEEVVSPLLHEKSIILFLQNGIGVEEEISQVFPQHGIAGGLAFLCSNKVGPGHIHHLDYGKVMLGALQDDLDLTDITQIFNDAKIPTDLNNDLIQARWQKLVWNIPYNGLCTIHNVDTSIIMQNYRGLCETIMREVEAAAAACNHPIPDDMVAKMLRNTEKMKPYMPSMMLDHQHGREMELTYMYERPISFAKTAGVVMTETQNLLTQLQALN